MEIIDHRDRPELASTVAQIQYDQWADFTGLSLDELQELFRPDVPRGELPVTLIAVEGDRVAAIVSLRRITMGAVKHPEVYIDGVYPWLSNMWVAEWARGQKLATRTSVALEDVARELGFGTIYSSTATEDSLYHKLDYRTTGQNPHHEYTVFLIRKEL
jgi:hypothetical protein